MTVSLKNVDLKMLSPRSQRLHRTSELVQISSEEVTSPEVAFQLFLNQGKVEEAISIFRFHFPFGEFLPDAIPQILSVSLPHARSNRLISLESFLDLLHWLEQEILTHLLPESRLVLSKLAETQANEIAFKTLPDEYSVHPHATSSRRHEILQTLTLAKIIAKSGGLTNLESTLEESIELFTLHSVLRPNRILFCVDENKSLRFELDVEAMLIQFAFNGLVNMKESTTQWCAQKGLDFFACVVSFLNGNPVLFTAHTKVVLECAEWLKSNVTIWRRVISLCISRFAPPFPPELSFQLEDETDMENKAAMVRHMRIREVAAKYSPYSYFDFTKHLGQLQRHLCILIAGALDMILFQSYMKDLFALSSRFDRPQLFVLILESAAHNIGLEEESDRLERIHRLFQELDSKHHRLLVCQEVIQYLLLCCDDSENDDEIERVLTANWGVTLCQFAMAKLYDSQSYLNLSRCLHTFQRVLQELLQCEAEETTTTSPQESSTALQWFLKEDISCEKLDDISDTLLIREIKLACELSLEKQSNLPGRYRDCPNVLSASYFVPLIQLVLESKRRRRRDHHVTAPLVASTPVDASLFFQEGAYQLALRLKAHMDMHFPAPKTTALSHQFILTMLAQNALVESVADEPLLVGYLLALSRKDQVFMALNVQLKDFQNESDSLKFERLSWIAKQLAMSWQDQELTLMYTQKESIFAWLNKLQQRRNEIAMDQTKLMACDKKEVQTVAVCWLKSEFAFTMEWREHVLEDLTHFLSTFSGPTKQTTHSIAGCIIELLMSDTEALVDSQILYKWVVSCPCHEIPFLHSSLEALSLNAKELSRVRTILDVLLEVRPCEMFMCRTVLVELFREKYWDLQTNPELQVLVHRKAFSSFPEAELIQLVCVGFSLATIDFVRRYFSLPQQEELSDVNTVLSVIDSLFSDVESKAELAVMQLTRCTTCQQRLELMRFAHSLFPMRFQTELYTYETQAIFEEFQLAYPADTSAQNLLRLIYESEPKNKRKLFASVMTIMKGDLPSWTKTLKRCLVDWLQDSSLLTRSIVPVIVQALEHLQREAEVDSIQFLTNIAFATNARIKIIAVVRALQSLQSFRELTLQEKDLLWMKEKELAMRECNFFKQTIEQVVNTRNKESSIRGLMREVCQNTALSPEQEVKCLEFIAHLIRDFDLVPQMESDVSQVYHMLCQLDVGHGIEVLLQLPPKQLIYFKEDDPVWQSCFFTEKDLGLMPQMLALLERCPWPEVTKHACQKLMQHHPNNKRIKVLFDRCNVF